MRKGYIYALIASYITAVGMMLASVLYANDVNNDSDRKWCDLVSVLDDTYSVTPPASDIGKRIAQAIHQLRIDFKC